MTSFMKNKTFYRTSIDSLPMQIKVDIGLFSDVIACVNQLMSLLRFGA